MSPTDRTQTYLQRVHRQDRSFSYTTSYPLEVRPRAAYEAHITGAGYDLLKTERLLDESLVTTDRSESFWFLLAERK